MFFFIFFLFVFLFCRIKTAIIMELETIVDVPKGKARAELERKTTLRMDGFTLLVKLPFCQATRSTDNVNVLSCQPGLKLSSVGAFSSFHCFAL